MRHQTYIVAGDLPMFDAAGTRVDPGGEITLEDSELVRMNVESGMLELKRRQKGDAEDAPRMTCPICAEHMKRPPKFESAEELAGHYRERHAGFAVPDWEDDS